MTVLSPPPVALPAQAVVDPRIGVCAQFALLRMRQADPASRAVAAGLLSAVKRGALAGIHAENVKPAARLAAGLGLTWWKLIPAGEDAALVVDPADPAGVAPTIVFRSTQTVHTPPGTREQCLDAARLDAGLRRASVSFEALAAGRLLPCHACRDAGTQTEVSGCQPAPNVVPAGMCLSPVIRTGGHPPRPPVTPKRPPKAFAKATTIKAYIALVREAERRLIAAGSSSDDARAQILSEIYYGTNWSRDFDVEKSRTRNAAFLLYTGRASAGPDPRPVLGASLFGALKASGDVVVDAKIGTADLGHVMIGLNARCSLLPRVANIPTQGGTGLEIVTWVGDLGGAAGRLARDRANLPRTPATKYFTGRTGKDYGADSNLEGDVAAYVVASGSAATTLQPLTLPTGSLIADSLAAYFLSPPALAARAGQFLRMNGATFAGGTITNRAAIENVMAEKLAAFGLWYVTTRYGAAALAQAVRAIGPSAREIAALFVGWLLARTAAPASPGRRGPPARPRARPVTG